MHVEFRAGEGGEDAVRFAHELAAALTAYSARHGWQVIPVHTPEAKTLILTVRGPLAALEPFAGVHRIQRVPVNDKQGRRQTSTATVAVLPDPEDRGPVTLDDREIRVDLFRGSGPGGQHRNKVETAVRLTHLPSGIVITRTSGRSKTANLAAARADLAARLTAGAAQTQAAGRAGDRRAQITSSERAAKAFTHNQQRDEVRDHRTGRRWSMRAFAQGRLD